MWTLAVIITVVWASYGLLVVLPITFLFDRKRAAMHGVSVAWASALIAVHPLWKLSKRVKTPAAQGPYVIVANHQSMLDILVVLAAVPTHFKFIAKKELFSVPWIGWHMRGSGYIALDRGSAQSGRDTLAAAKQWLDRGVSVLFFPEGTRSEDEEIKAFKNGAFKIAMEKNVPLLPVVLDGTGKASPKKSKAVGGRAVFEVEIMEPVSANGRDLETVREQVRDSMVRRLAEMRKKA